MARTEAADRGGQVGDAAVRAATGKDWHEWFALLDHAGARSMSHQQIVAVVAHQPGVSGWWQQMVTVSYELARGLRDKHQKADGYAVSVHKTIEAPVEAVFEAWQNEKIRGRWLHESSVTIRKATLGKSLRITWVDGKTNVDVNLATQGATKARVGVQHSKLVDAEQAAERKAYWASALESLKRLLEREDPR